MSIEKDIIGFVEGAIKGDTDVGEKFNQAYTKNDGVLVNNVLNDFIEVTRLRWIAMIENRQLVLEFIDKLDKDDIDLNIFKKLVDRFSELTNFKYRTKINSDVLDEENISIITKDSMADEAYMALTLFKDSNEIKDILTSEKQTLDLVDSINEWIKRTNRNITIKYANS